MFSKQKITMPKSCPNATSVKGALLIHMFVLYLVIVKNDAHQLAHSMTKLVHNFTELVQKASILSFGPLVPIECEKV